MNSTIHKAALAAFTAAMLGIAGCTTNNDTSPPTIPTPNATANATPANATSMLVTIGDKEVTKRPQPKPSGDNGEYFIELLRYTQTLASKGGVPVPKGGLSYHLLRPGQVLECDESRSPSTVDRDHGYYAIMWCPVFKGFVINPSVSRDAEPDVEMLAGAFYGGGIAQLTNATRPEIAATCYHGLILREETKDNPIEWRAAPKKFVLFYEGGASTEEGLLKGTCTKIN